MSDENKKDTPKGIFEVREVEYKPFTLGGLQPGDEFESVIVELTEIDSTN